MQVSDCPIPGLKLVKLALHGDGRGFFVERFHEARFAEAGLPTHFLQDNHSRSAPGILRGLHYQYDRPMGKLVGVVRGAIWDVALDVRPGSPTFGKHYAVELTAENGLLLWMPAGFAHGFCAIGDEPADVCYKVDAFYNPQGEGGIRYDDPDLAIDWPVKNPTLSARDAVLGSWRDYCAAPPRWEGLA